MTNKIIVDTNVVIAASIIQNIVELGIVVKHKFYDQSIQLFSLFKRDNDCYGVLVPTVKTESFTMPVRAVYDTFLSDSSANPQLRTLFYKDAAGIVTSSERKMKKLMRRLKEGEYDHKELCKNIERVKSMSRDLQTEWEERHAGKNRRRPESDRRAKTVLKEPRNQEQKKEVSSAHDARITRESLQLGRFVRKSNSRDELILAETISVMQFDEKTGGSYDFWIASCDSGFFAPYIRSHLGTSDTVTREIKNRFKIRCDYPQKIYRLLS